jgi:transposase InsO family protein
VALEGGKVPFRKYFELYNFKRPHQALGYATPAEVYFDKIASVKG